MRGDAYVLCAVVPWKSENEKKGGGGGGRKGRGCMQEYMYCISGKFMFWWDLYRGAFNESISEGVK